VPVAIDGNLKDYEMSMFTRQALPEPSNLSNNTTMKQLELNAQMLRQTLKLNQTNFMPTLAASFSYQYTAMDNKFNIKNYTWRPYSTIGLSLSIPLFKASNWTTLKQTRIQMKQLEENRLNTERQLTMQATSYLDNMAASTESVVSNKEAVYQAQKARDIADKRYQVGKGTILELNSSEVALTESRLTYNQSIYDYLVAKADLDLVIGNEEITEPVNE
jgi:outer membrane protein TolC